MQNTRTLNVVHAKDVCGVSYMYMLMEISWIYSSDEMYICKHEMSGKFILLQNLVDYPGLSRTGRLVDAKKT